MYVFVSTPVTAPFRPLENPQNRKDEIVIAAISAFVGRTRPTRFEANQLEDLVLPILPYTEPATRRLAAACISHSPHAPHGLVMRLCEEETEVCAALLLRSPVLQDADLIRLVESRGIAFARVIARRPTLTQKIRNLLLALGDPMIATALHADRPALPELHPAISADPAEISVKLEAARNALRDMMRPKADPASQLRPPLKHLKTRRFRSPPRFTARREPQHVAARLRATALLVRRFILHHHACRYARSFLRADQTHPATFHALRTDHGAACCRIDRGGQPSSSPPPIFRQSPRKSTKSRCLLRALMPWCMIKR